MGRLPRNGVRSTPATDRFLSAAPRRASGAKLFELRDWLLRHPPTSVLLVVALLLLLMGVVALVIWRIFEWTYKMRLDKAQFYIDMAALEHAKERLGKGPWAGSSRLTKCSHRQPRRGIVDQARAANNAVTQNLNAASMAMRPVMDFVYCPPTRHEAIATTLVSEAPHPPTARKPDHR